MSFFTVVLWSKLKSRGENIDKQCRAETLYNTSLFLSRQTVKQLICLTFSCWRNIQAERMIVVNNYISEALEVPLWFLSLKSIYLCSCLTKCLNSGLEVVIRWYILHGTKLQTSWRCFLLFVLLPSIVFVSSYHQL